ncbi:hypothetical protein HYH03_007176 [Edaphochlamys debaryana]|uniref:LysM domain-containing protein n=1 Tax=Edaphochlamys debaryana TaxID=47281 RepID=A0A835Y937_9CHLO|nr:hypothetical protein HYH03_007176 [Edaphochlamys debaryana]|eukprot:KAG2494660.1 hypothetical protein HYH03_007176 [Edaphochlamys debaryana]
MSNYAGDELAGPYSTLLDTENACDGNSSCVGFLWNPTYQFGTGAGFLRSSILGGATLNGLCFYTRNLPPPAAPSPPSPPPASELPRGGRDGMIGDATCAQYTDFYAVPDVGHYGDLLFNGTYSTAADYASACWGDASCRSFSWDTYGLYGETKTNATIDLYAQWGVCYYVKYGACTAVSGYIDAAGQDYTYATLGGPYSSLAATQAACDTDGSCLGFTWDPSQNNGAGQGYTKPSSTPDASNVNGACFYARDNFPPPSTPPPPPSPVAASPPTGIATLGWIATTDGALCSQDSGVALADVAATYRPLTLQACDTAAAETFFTVYEYLEGGNSSGYYYIKSKRGSCLTAQSSSSGASVGWEACGNTSTSVTWLQQFNITENDYYPDTFLAMTRDSVEASSPLCMEAGSLTAGGAVSMETCDSFSDYQMIIMAGCETVTYAASDGTCEDLWTVKAGYAAWNATLFEAINPLINCASLTDGCCEICLVAPAPVLPSPPPPTEPPPGSPSPSPSPSPTAANKPQLKLTTLSFLGSTDGSLCTSDYGTEISDPASVSYQMQLTNCDGTARTFFTLNEYLDTNGTSTGYYTLVSDRGSCLTAQLPGSASPINWEACNSPPTDYQLFDIVEISGASYTYTVSTRASILAADAQCLSATYGMTAGQSIWTEPCNGANSTQAVSFFPCGYYHNYTATDGSCSNVWLNVGGYPSFNQTHFDAINPDIDCNSLTDGDSICLFAPSPAYSSPPPPSDPPPPGGPSPSLGPTSSPSPSPSPSVSQPPLGLVTFGFVVQTDGQCTVDPGVKLNLTDTIEQYLLLKACTGEGETFFTMGEVARSGYSTNWRTLKSSRGSCLMAQQAGADYKAVWTDCNGFSVDLQYFELRPHSSLTDTYQMVTRSSIVSADEMCLQADATTANATVTMRPCNASLASQFVVFSGCQNITTVSSGDTCSDLWTGATASAWDEQAFYALNPFVNCSTLAGGEELCLQQPASNSGCTLYTLVTSNDTCDSLWAAGGNAWDETAFYDVNPSVDCLNLPAAAEPLTGRLAAKPATEPAAKPAATQSSAHSAATTKPRSAQSASPEPAATPPGAPAASAAQPGPAEP